MPVNSASPTWINAFADLLAALGFGKVGTDLFRGQLPLDFLPANLATVIVPYAGSASERSRDVITPRVQIMCRGPYQLALQRAWDIYSALDNSEGKKQGNWAFTYIKGLSTPNSLGPDDRGAFKIVCNYQLTFEGTSGL